MNFNPNLAPLVDPRVEGHSVLLDHGGQRVYYRDITQGGRLVAMDLGPADVHYDRPLATYATGFALQQEFLIADKVMPAVMVEKPSDLYYKWDKDDAFQEVQASVSTAASNILEVSPRQSRTPFATLQYAVRTFLPTETEAAGDAALKLAMRYLNLPMEKLLLSRELRVMRKVTDAAKYGADYKMTLAAGFQWNGGANSDPIKDIHARMDASLRPITHIAMSQKVYNAFVRNPAVQKYIASKTAVAPKPSVENAAKFAALLELPEFVIGREKYKNTATTYDFIWGNDVVLYHLPKVMPPMGQAISWNTFRWTGGLDDGINIAEAQRFGSVSFSAGWGVRTYFDQTRGAQGGRGCVVWHQDDEHFVEDTVSGLIVGAWQ